jgi:hypothetical protein
MTKLLPGLLVFFTIFNIASMSQAQWWGSESLPGNPNHYTYRTRFGYWQYGALERNIATSQKYADRGIIRDWNDGAPIAVDRNLPGGRFAQQGVPNLVYVPRINYFDNLGYLTDIQYRSGLRQYWPDNQQLLIHEWEQKTYEPEHLPANAGQVAPTATLSQTPAAAPEKAQQNRVQTYVIKQVPAKPAEKKLSYHERVMQGHAERRAAEEERMRRYAQQLAEYQQSAADSRATSPQELQQQPGFVDPLWFRDQTPPPRQLRPTATGSQTSYGTSYGMSAITYTIPGNPLVERERQLEYALAGSPEISFYSPFQAKFTGGLENGTVTVTGLVGSEQQRLAAERILLAQPGVKNVQNLMTVAD